MTGTDWRNDPVLKAVLNKIGDDYEFIKYIGGGGFGNVFLLEHKRPSISKLRALKIIDAVQIFYNLRKKGVKNVKKEYDKWKERTKREATTSSKINHPNIVNVLDMGVVEEPAIGIQIPYFVMPFIKGENLEKKIKSEKRLNNQDILNISIDILCALDKIHKKGILHRDIKPSNIMIDEKTGKAILIDFGLVKVLGQSNITATGKAIGTTYYMSPEQRDGRRKLTPSSDIFSFGKVLIDMLVGFNTSRMIGRSVADLEREGQNLPKGLVGIVKNTIANNPKDRYQDSLELLSDLKSTIDPLNSFGGKPMVQAQTSVQRFAAVLVPIEKTIATWLKELFSLGKDAYFRTKRLIQNSFPNLKRPLALVLLLISIVSVGAFFIILNNGWSSGLEPPEKILGPVNGDQKSSKIYSRPRDDPGSNEKSSADNTIVQSHIEDMRQEYEALKKDLKKEPGLNKKIQMCRAFKTKCEKVPFTPEIRTIIGHLDTYIKKYTTEKNERDKNDRQYKELIVSAEGHIKKGEFAKAETDLEKAKKIKGETERVLGLEKAIEQGKREYERVHGKKRYNKIKGNVNIQKYLKFKEDYPESKHLPDLQKRLRKMDENLPTVDNDWGTVKNPIEKNVKGYYEKTFSFGEEENEHRMVYIPGKNFWIDKYEVSWRQYSNFSGDERYKVANRYIHDGDEFPAFVNFKNAKNYCKYYGMRLPKEDEWDYAAGKGQFIYPWGNELPDAGGVFPANSYGKADDFEGVAPVKSFEEFPSPFGLVNMAGNAMEWVRENVLKGGGFFSETNDLVIKKGLPGKNTDKEGFRCVLMKK